MIDQYPIVKTNERYNGVRRKYCKLTILFTKPNCGFVLDVDKEYNELGSTVEINYPATHTTNYFVGKYNEFWIEDFFFE